MNLGESHEILRQYLGLCVSLQARGHHTYPITLTVTVRAKKGGRVVTRVKLSRESTCLVGRVVTRVELSRGSSCPCRVVTRVEMT